MADDQSEDYISTDDKVPRNLLICCNLCDYQDEIGGYPWIFIDNEAYCEDCYEPPLEEDDKPYQPTEEEMKQLEGHLGVIAYCRLKAAGMVQE